MVSAQGLLDPIAFGPAVRVSHGGVQVGKKTCSLYEWEGEKGLGSHYPLQGTPLMLQRPVPNL